MALHYLTPNPPVLSPHRARYKFGDYNGPVGHVLCETNLILDNPCNPRDEQDAILRPCCSPKRWIVDEQLLLLLPAVGATTKGAR
jgi:hypothetical protein